MKITPTYGMVEVGRGRKKLDAAIRRGEKITIVMVLELNDPGSIGNFDGVGQEFYGYVKSAEVIEGDCNIQIIRPSL
jgi:hypothetical protein